VFITVPEDESDHIKEIVSNPGGFGSVRVEVTVGSSTWRTSVFPSSELGCFVLPLKKPVRKAENIDLGDEVGVSLEVLLT
jgi:hypothetical protein